MLSNEEVKQHLMSIEGVDDVQIQGDGYHYQLTIISDVFIDKSKLARQQWVYAQLNEYIVSGSLHALTMTTWTKQEWEKQHG